MTADAKPNVTAFVLLDHIRDDEELEAYVQARAAYEITLAVARERERWMLAAVSAVDALEGHASRCCESSIPDETVEALSKLRAAIRTTKAPT